MKIQVSNQALLDITPVSYVYVKPDLSPGMCSYGGNGFVMEVDANGILHTVVVKDDEAGSNGGKTESDIPYSHLTVIPTPFISLKLVHKCQSPDVFNVQALQHPTTTQVLSIQDLLASGALHGKKKGWRAKELEVAELGCQNESFQQLLHEDIKELLGFLSTSKGGSA